MIPEKHSADKTDDLARKTTLGLFWNFLAYGMSKGIVLLTTSILARILTKDDFGLVAIAMVALNYLSVIKDLGLGTAIIQRRGNIRDVADTVFTINLIMGLGLSIMVIPIAPLIANYFNDPQVTPVLRWLGISFFVSALGSIHIARLQRNLDYRRKLIPDLSSAFVKGVVSIVLALTGAGVWAIVFGQLSGAIASVLMVWIIFPWWPRLSLNLRLARGLIRFGASIMGTDAISITTENIDSIIVGRIFGLSQLSIYSLAYRLPEMLLLNNLWVMGGVIFPAFSTIQTQPDELRKGFLVSIRLIELITLPICLGLIIAATPIVLVLFGEQWLEVVPLLRVFAIYAWVSSIGYHVGDIYKARGRPDILLKLSLVTLVIIIPALLIGSRFGILGIAISHLVAMIIRRGISLTIATRLVKVSLLDILRELKPAFQGGSILTIVTLMVLLVTANMSVFLQLTLIILSGAFSYFCVIWLVERRKLLQLVKILKTSQ